MRRVLERLGQVTAAHPWRTLAGWLLAAVALIVLGEASGGTFVNDYRIPGAESQRAADLARDHMPGFGATSADIVLHVDDGTLDAPARAAAIRRMLDTVRTQPDVSAVGDPFIDGEQASADATVSPDGRTATVTVRYGKDIRDLTELVYHRLDAAAEPVRAEGVAVDHRGIIIERAFEPESGTAELVGLGVALLVLLIAFGSVVAAGLPILVALVGLTAGTGLVLLVGSVVDVPTAAPLLAVMLGLGAGIDYALFVVTRFRTELAAGHPPVEAAGRAVATAGHAVLFAGGTVVVAILGLVFAGIPFIATLGLATAITVAVMVIAAVTLLPALLGLLGHRVNRWRLFRRAPRPDGIAVAGRWARWGAHLTRRRVVYAVVSGGLLLALAAPLLSLRLGAPDDGNQPVTWPQRRAYDAVAAGFGPGFNAPLLITVATPAGAPDAAVTGLAGRLAADPEVQHVTEPVPSPDGDLALLVVIPRHAPQDVQVTDLVHRIRDTIAPTTLAGSNGRAYVGGQTAFIIDAADAVAVRLPWVVAGVVLAAGLLLFAMFRAPLIAVKATVMTALSVGAAYGVIVAVFQWDWGLSLLGLDQPVPIMSLVPMLLFAVLFGLSMDYEVFLLSAMREGYRDSGDPDQAVVAGLARTGRVITAAALIMSVVFISFASIDEILVKMIGVGLATAVIVDATVIRMVLAPAVMSLLGHRAWWPARRPTAAAPDREPHLMPAAR